ELASCSVFFGVNMFKVEKRATTSYKVPFSGTRNRTLSFSLRHGFSISLQSNLNSLEQDTGAYAELLKLGA
ncbi:MAG: hypothetical protein WC353_00595, partial [Candidatus Peribacter sp.]